MKRTIVIAALSLVSCGGDETSTTAGSSARSRRSSSSSSSSGEAALVGSGSSINEICWSTINEYRKRDGLPPYERWESSETCADGEAKSDAESGRGHGAFPRCKELAQNECPGIEGPPEEAIAACLAAMWAQGPGEGHHDNMASTKYTEAACGVFVTARGEVWSVQNFR